MRGSFSDNSKTLRARIALSGHAVNERVFGGIVTTSVDASPPIIVKEAALLPRIPTGNPGLDEVLLGGLPKGRTTVVSGGPGCGKSILGLEFLVRGAQAGQPGILVPFEERVEAVRANALTLGWDLAALEKQNLIMLVDAHIDHDMLMSGRFDLQGLLAIIDGASRFLKAERLVLDAIDVLLRYYNDLPQEREQFLFLNDWLLDHKLTTVLTVKRSELTSAGGRYEYLDYLADCVIHLDQRVNQQVTTRRMRVVKYRGSNYGRNEYPYVTGVGGITVIPISGAELRHKPLGEAVSSGQVQLDEMLGGGYLQNSCVLIAGASGTGKTTLASLFARAACERKEKVLFVGFEESTEALTGAMLSSGTDLRPAIAAGQLRTLTAMPESAGIEEHLVRVANAMTDLGPQHIVLDAISAVRRMGSERATFEFLVRLVGICRERGVTLIINNQTKGAEQAGEIAGEESSSLVDAIIALRYIEVGGETNRLISVIKSRGMNHSNQLREFRITDNGVELADIYAGEGGVLTGAARQEKEARDSVERRRTEAIVEAKRSEITRRKAELDAETTRLTAAVEQAEIELEQLEIERHKLSEGLSARLALRGGEKANANQP
jgi:circadian clock protein KaiC